MVTCSAEDLVVLKAFADRTQDWADVEGVCARQGERLDWDYVVRQLSPLCEAREDVQPLVRVRELRRRSAQP